MKAIVDLLLAKGAITWPGWHESLMKRLEAAIARRALPEEEITIAGREVGRRHVCGEGAGGAKQNPSVFVTQTERSLRGPACRPSDRFRKPTVAATRKTWYKGLNEGAGDTQAASRPRTSWRSFPPALQRRGSTIPLVLAEAQ